MRVNNIRNWIVSLAIIMSAGGAMLTMAAPQVVMAADTNCNSGFLGFPAWYRGLTNADCTIKSPNDAGGLSGFIWHIVLNCIEIALVAVSYITAFLVLYGGFLFIISQGKPEGAARARMTILDAIIGLIISMASVALINFVIDGIWK
ncbi:MAG: hypothetical protein WCJ36_03295 [Candidatus Saccharibacteria bacterium]